MRHILSIVLAAALAGSPSLAADSKTAGTLAPGKPAGAREASISTGNVLLLAGVGGFAAGLVLILMHAHGSVKDGGSTATTTTG